MRLIAIGDIHGMDRQLGLLLERLELDSDDRLVFLGDYIDRGPDSREVIERLIALRETRPDTVFLRGNHEQMLLDALAEFGRYAGPTLQELSPRYAGDPPGSATLLYLYNGGTTLLESYRIDSLERGLPPEHLDFIATSRLYWEQAPFLFVHAGADPALPPQLQDPFTLLWDRTSPPGTGDRIHIVGHQPTRNGPVFEPGRYRIDTGAGHGRSLTACDVLTRRFWQA